MLSDIEKLCSLVFMREEPAVISQPHTAVVGVRAWANPYEICAEQSGTEPFFVSRTSIFPCRYHSAIAVY